MTTHETEYWDDVGRDWKVKHPDSLWRAHSDAVNTALIEKWLGADRLSSLLKTDSFDEANSEGLFKQLSSHAGTLIEIDISVETLIAARSRHPGLKGMVADVRRLPFATGNFDVIFSNSTLDHFPTMAQLEASIVELHRVLKPGGQLLLTLDNAMNPIVALRNALPFNWLNRAGIVPYYVGATCGPKRLRAMLERAGFDVGEMGAVLHCPRVFAVALTRLIRYGSPTSRRFLAGLMSFERLSRWPTRFFTGYFIAVKAVKRGAGE